MEERENILLAKLQTTQTKQRQAYSSLESMVQVGYSYYNQCYELKKKKQADMLPGMRDQQSKQSSPNYVHLSDQVRGTQAGAYVSSKPRAALGNTSSAGISHS